MRWLRACRTQAAVGAMARVPNRITQAHFTRLLTGMRALSWTVYPNELGKVLDEAARLMRIDADSRCPPPTPPPPPPASRRGEG